jgi:serine/threonine-protein kinase
VVLALLVLLCAGVISFLLKQGNLNAISVPAPHSVATDKGATGSNGRVASYRLTRVVPQQAGPARSVHGSRQSHSLMTEGRRTL